MPKSNIVIIGGNTYRSQKECENDVRNKLTIIGTTRSLKKKSLDAYKFFIELCGRHPEAREKLKNIIDFEIRNDALNTKAFAINIVNGDRTITEISWRVCVTGKGYSSKQSYNSALRTAIKPQIVSYKKNANLDICSICDTNLVSGNIHIDHIIHFDKLVKDFTNIYNINIPNNYDKVPETYERIFKLDNQSIGDLFYDYHLQNAKLRVVCKKCNLSRSKYRPH